MSYPVFSAHPVAEDLHRESMGASLGEDLDGLSSAPYIVYQTFWQSWIVSQRQTI